MDQFYLNVFVAAIAVNLIILVVLLVLHVRIYRIIAGHKGNPPSIKVDGQKAKDLNRSLAHLESKIREAERNQERIRRQITERKMDKGKLSSREIGRGKPVSRERDRGKPSSREMDRGKPASREMDRGKPASRERVRKNGHSRIQRRPPQHDEDEGVEAMPKKDSGSSVEKSFKKDSSRSMSTVDKKEETTVAPLVSEPVPVQSQSAVTDESKSESMPHHGRRVVIKRRNLSEEKEKNGADKVVASPLPPDQEAGKP
jgi:hypothetical protein